LISSNFEDFNKVFKNLGLSVWSLQNVNLPKKKGFQKLFKYKSKSLILKYEECEASRISKFFEYPLRPFFKVKPSEIKGLFFSIKNFFN